MEKTPLFKRFLIGKNVLKEFVANYDARFSGHGHQIEDYINLMSHDSSAIAGAFGWSDSPEEENFWNDLHFKWKDFLSKHNDAT